MANDVNERAVIGGNQPPEPIDTATPSQETMVQRWDRDDKALFDRIVELELGAKAIPAEITTKDVASRAVSFVAQCRLAMADLLKVHKERKAPFLAMTRLIDKRYLHRNKKFADAVLPIERRAEAFRKRVEEEQRVKEAEQRRRAQEQAARQEEAARQLAAQAREAEEAGNRRAAVTLNRQATEAAEAAETQQAIAALPPQPVRIHGEHGATAFVTRTWKFWLADPELLPAQYWKPDDEAIQAELDAAIKVTGKPPAIPGVEFFEEERGHIRRC